MRSEGRGAHDRAAVAVRGSSVLVLTVTGNKPCSFSCSRTRHQETERDLSCSIFPSSLNSMTWPQHAAVRDESNLLLSKPKKLRWFGENHILPLHTGMQAFTFLHPTLCSGHCVQPQTWPCRVTAQALFLSKHITGAGVQVMCSWEQNLRTPLLVEKIYF